MKVLHNPVEIVSYRTIKGERTKVEERLVSCKEALILFLFNLLTTWRGKIDRSDNDPNPLTFLVHGEYLGDVLSTRFNLLGDHPRRLTNPALCYEGLYGLDEDRILRWLNFQVGWGFDYNRARWPKEIPGNLVVKTVVLMKLGRAGNAEVVLKVLAMDMAQLLQVFTAVVEDDGWIDGWMVDQTIDEILGN